MNTDHQKEYNESMVRERFRVLANQIPILYAVVAISTLAIALTFHGKITPWISLGSPALICFVACSRSVFWVGMRAEVDDLPVATMLKEMRRTLILGPALSFFLTMLGLFIIGEVGPYQQAFTMLTLWVSIIICAFCLFALPNAAYSVVGAGGVPICIAILYSGDPMLTFAACLLLVIALLFVYMLRYNYVMFLEIVVSRARSEVGRRLAEQDTEETRRLANSDFLTGLSNRRHFEEALRHRARLAADQRKPFAIAMLDLDGFKPVNDTYGHAAGDEVLIEVARRLERLVHGRGFVARLGGDEFALLIEGMHKERDAKALGLDIADIFAEPFTISQGTVRVGSCCGVALFPTTTDQIGDLVELADAALYACKASRATQNAMRLSIAQPPHAYQGQLLPARKPAYSNLPKAS